MAEIKKRKRLRATKRQAVLMVMLLALISGVAIGAIAAYAIDGAGYAEITSGLSEYLRGFSGTELNRMDFFRESMLKYGKLFAFLWLLAFLPELFGVPVGGLAATLLIMFRGASYGFATATLIRGYGMAGTVCAAILYMPQSLFLVPAYLFTATRCVLFMTQKGHSGRGSDDLAGYALVLVIGIAAGVAAAFIDAFIVPGLVANLI